VPGFQVGVSIGGMRCYFKSHGNFTIPFLVQRASATVIKGGKITLSVG
jgi:hypothetical protein